MEVWMTTSALSVLLEFTSRFQTEGAEGVLDLLTDDFVLHECDSVPYPGDHVGKQALVEFSRKFHEVWSFDSIGFPDHRYLESENHVVMLGTAPVTARATGIKIDLRAVEVFTIRDGK